MPPNSPRLTVLLVDDNPHDRGMVRRELRHEFGTVEFVEVTDASGLAVALNAPTFDLVVTDFRIRWTDGLSVLRAVKEKLPYCPVLMFTATGSEEVAVESMKSGLDDYIIKNVKHFVRLRGAARAAIDHSATRRRADRLASRLSTLLQQLRIGAFSCTIQGCFIEVNDAMSQLLAARLSGDAPVQSLLDLFPDSTQGERFLHLVRTTSESHDAEFELSTDDGEPRVYRLSATRIEINGEGRRIDGVVEDITQRRRMEADRKRAAVAAAQVAMLSPRELEVLKEVAAGNPNKAIARHLDISEKTVEKHRASMMKKLQVRSVAELVRLSLLADTDTR